MARAADPQSLGELQKAVSVEKDASAKLAMEFALAALGKEDALNDVVSELGSKMRGDVARSYLTELARNPAFLPKLYPYLQSPDAGMRKRLCVVLMYSGDQGSLQQLDRLEHDPDNDVAAAALRAKQRHSRPFGRGGARCEVPEESDCPLAVERPPAGAAAKPHPGELTWVHVFLSMIVGIRQSIYVNYNMAAGYRRLMWLLGTCDRIPLSTQPRMLH